MKYLILIFLSCSLFLVGCSKKDSDKASQPGPPGPSDPILPPFISVWKTSSENESITLPLRRGYTYDFNVDWGDGSSSEVTSYDDPDITHTYVEAKEYTVTISGTLEAWYFNYSGSKDKIISVKDLGTVNWKNLERAFAGCKNLGEVKGGDVSGVTNMTAMFREAHLATPDVSGWDTSNVTNMSYMFSYATSANPDISGWNISQVTDIRGMFGFAKAAHPDMSQWDFSEVTNMSYLFTGVTLPTKTYNNLLNRINETSQKSDVTLHGGHSQHNSDSEAARTTLTGRGWIIGDGGMEGDEESTPPPSPFISEWTVTANEDITLPLKEGYNYNFTVNWGDESSSEVTSYDDSDITHTYDTAGTYTVTISGTVEAWYFNDGEDKNNIISVKNLGDVGWKDLNGAFWGCTNLKELYGGNVSGVINMEDMFRNNSSLANLDISQWDVSNVTNMHDMFISNSSLVSLDISQWDVSSVTDMSGMFSQASLTNLDVSQWDISNVTDMNSMFSQAYFLANLDVSHWNVSNATTMEEMFNSVSLANPDVSQWNVSNVTVMRSMFRKASLANPDVSQWNVSNVTGMRYMFHQASSANPDVSQWDVSNVTDMVYIFNEASSANPDVSHWNVSNITDMSGMFRLATSANPDMSRWDFGKVTNMTEMFFQVTLPTETYSAMLKRIVETSEQTGVTLRVGSSKYNKDAQAARKILRTPVAEGGLGWKIIDGGIEE